MKARSSFARSGRRRAKTVIKDALARGADRAIHVVVEGSNKLSPYQIAKAIADAIREENADLVFTGLQSDDASYGQTGVILAELLGIPHATIVIEVDRGSLSDTVCASNASWKAAGINGLRTSCRRC